MSSVRVCLTGVAVSCAASLFAFGASAATFTAADILTQFNVVTKNDLNTNQEIEGRAYVGGDVVGNSLQVNFKTGAPASQAAGLIVEGDVSLSTLNVFAKNPQGPVNAVSAAIRGAVTGPLNNQDGNSGPQAQVGGAISGPANINTVQNQAGNAAFEAQFPNRVAFLAELDDLSSDLSALTANALATSPSGNSTVFNAMPVSGLSVYDIDFADLNKGSIDLQLNGADTVIINVDGDGILNDNFVGGPFATANHVIWNFYNATSLTLQTQFFGAVLAPYAELTNTSPVEGGIFVDTLNLSGEAHLQPFEGTFPAAEVSAVPLPASGWALVAAVGAVTGLRRRKAARG